MTGTAPVFTAQEFLEGFQKLLPTGPVWPRDADAVQTQVLAALVQLYVNNTASAADLLVDAFPPTTDYLLLEWQETLGLPDPCEGQLATLAQQQAQVLSRFIAGGGQSATYFISFAASLGYPITITQFAPFRAGVSTAGSPAYGAAWAFVWQVNTAPVDVEFFTVGNSTVGQALETVTGSTVLQCELVRLSPAHTNVLFNFVSADFTAAFSSAFA